MLQIQVSFETITPQQTSAVIDYYNQHKNADWNRKRLLCGRYGKYLNVFTDDETNLLYNAMVSVFGKEVVELENL